MPAHGAQHRAMSAGESEGARLGVETFIKRLAKRENAAARSGLEPEDQDRQAGLTKQIGGAQSGKAGAHDDRRVVVDCANAGARERDCGKGAARAELKEAPAIHGAIMRSEAPDLKVGPTRGDCGRHLTLQSPRLRSSVREALSMLRRP
jgi:hypothetical protein